MPDRAVPGFEFADRLNRHSNIPPRVLGSIDQLSENRCRAAARPRLKSVNLSEAAIIFIDTQKFSAITQFAHTYTLRILGTLPIPPYSADWSAQDACLPQEKFLSVEDLNKK